MKIDRVLVNSEWLNSFDKSVVVFLLHEGTMDHSPCCMNIFGLNERAVKPFKFFNHWTSAPGFLMLVQQEWDFEVRGTAMFRVVKMLQAVKKAIKDKNLGSLSTIEAADVEAYVNLMNVQKKMNLDPCNGDLISEENHARIVFQKAHFAKYSFLKQKAKLHWLKEGDLNTCFFHAYIQKRKVQNRICSVIQDGQVIQKPSEVINAFVGYYQNMLGSNCNPERFFHDAIIAVGRTLSQEQRVEMCLPFTEADVKDDLWSIEDDKAPGPDGFSSKFYKASWDIVKNDLYEVVLSFFLSWMSP
ncbi:uncharacterized protein LOC110709210 [Chenopodium quinoa]|uniref:uncharacterized protein LOC110709210 n=1 Tax=Chenopodium quinoa TaxID=63459 RepID=UPI000B7756C8|nr:uncharacterized protein LOC110709210 [Chenopodium quinoa]